MQVYLTYFTPTGKYYSSAEKEIEFTDSTGRIMPLDKIWSKVREDRQYRMLPGLKTGHSDFIVLVDVPEHPHNHPRLLMLSNE